MQITNKQECLKCGSSNIQMMYAAKPLVDLSKVDPESLSDISGEFVCRDCGEKFIFDRDYKNKE
jgi:hypothetical protein